MEKRSYAGQVEFDAIPFAARLGCLRAAGFGSGSKNEVPGCPRIRH